MLGLPDLLYLSRVLNRLPGDSAPGKVARVAAKSERDEPPGAAPRTPAGRSSADRKRAAVGHRTWRPSGW